MVRQKIKSKPEKEKNKLKQGRQRRAMQLKEAWIRYESDLAKYDRRKLEQEVEERRTANTPYNRIQEALEELEATSHPSEKQEQYSRTSIFGRIYQHCTTREQTTFTLNHHHTTTSDNSRLPENMPRSCIQVLFK